MFYADSYCETYRLGDILQGFTEILPVFQLADNNPIYNLQITPIKYFTILTPCCSIENKEALIAPLKKLDSKFLSNPYFIKDFLLINKPLKKRVALGEKIFGGYSIETQIQYDNAPPNYEFLDKFVFQGDKVFPEYELTRKFGKDDIVTIKTNYYMVSFKDAIRIRYDMFDRKAKNCNKVLEMSISARHELRLKLTKFYSRIPQEDQPYIDDDMAFASR